MKQTELFPFSKNRYYKGKMLTSADFEAEQRFVEEKSRFVGKIINGTGIACGLHVTAMDDKSILLESGMAIDGEGREIIVEKSNVFKLSSVAGFRNYRQTESHLASAIKRMRYSRCICLMEIKTTNITG